MTTHCAPGTNTALWVTPQQTQHTGNNNPHFLQKEELKLKEVKCLVHTASGAGGEGRVYIHLIPKHRLATSVQRSVYKTKNASLPCQTVVRPANTGDTDHRFHPWSRKITCLRTTQPVLHNKSSLASEKPKHYNCKADQLEKAQAATESQCSQNKQTNKYCLY